MISYFTYLAMLLTTFLGVFFGGILALIAPEELKAGEKSWQIMRYVFVLLMIIAVFYYSAKYSNMVTAILISAALVFLKLANWEYPAFAFVLFFSSISQDFLITTASLIFIYGLFTGTLSSKSFLVSKLNKYKRISLKEIKLKNIFLGILKSNILYLIFGVILLPFLAYL